MDKKDYNIMEEKMNKTISVMKEKLSNIRAGRANTTLLEKIFVDYYGVKTPINQLGNISVPEARMIIIQPWDANMLKEIEKAIQKSDIGINPNNDGKVIRLVFPVLTEERRKELQKLIKKEGEESKVAIRSIRREAIEHFKAMEKKSEITEDDLKDAENEVQKHTDKFTKEIDIIIEAKGKEIMEV